VRFGRPFRMFWSPCWAVKLTNTTAALKIHHHKHPPVHRARESAQLVDAYVAF
jgi:hypothetical protein